MEVLSGSLTVIVISGSVLLVSAILMFFLIKEDDVEKKSIYSSTLKFVICSFFLAYVVTSLGHIIKVKELENSQQKELYDLIPRIVGTPVESKYELAQFFSNLDLSPPVHNAWVSYKDELNRLREENRLKEIETAEMAELQAKMLEEVEATLRASRDREQIDKLKRQVKSLSAEKKKTDERLEDIQMEQRAIPIIPKVIEQPKERIIERFSRRSQSESSQ